MKFQPDTTEGVNAITRQEPGCVIVGSQSFMHSVLVPWQGEVLPWAAATLSDLTAAHFERIAALGPEVVIFGSGRRLRFAAPALMQALIARGVGVETMDTAAACRTYTVLASERRRVVAALIIEAVSPPPQPAETL